MKALQSARCGGCYHAARRRQVASRTVVLPFPLPASVRETYVIVPIVNGLAHADVLHLPARAKRYPIFRGEHEKLVEFVDRMEDGFSPESWPSACGYVEKGSVYVKGGVLERQPLCIACVSALREGEPSASGACPSPAAGPADDDVAAAPTTLGEQPSPSLNADTDRAEEAA